jgi:hypothetical protein
VQNLIMTGMISSGPFDKPIARRVVKTIILFLSAHTLIHVASLRKEHSICRINIGTEKNFR